MPYLAAKLALWTLFGAGLFWTTQLNEHPVQETVLPAGTLSREFMMAHTWATWYHVILGAEPHPKAPHTPGWELRCDSRSWGEKHR